MGRMLSILATAMLAAAIGGSSIGQAQDKTSSGAKCGPEEWSTDKMAYTNVPCPGEEGAAQTAQAPGKAKCGLEVWSAEKLIYETLPCPPGVTEENPGHAK